MGKVKVYAGGVVRKVGCGGSAGSGFTAVTDNFNRANSTTTLGAPWTVASEGGGGSPAWGISSNQAYCSATHVDGFGTAHSTLAYQDVGSGDVDITATLAVPSNANGVLLRLSGTATFFIVNSANITWFSGGGSIVHAHSSGFASGDVMRVLAVGSSIQVFKNGASVNSITDTRNQAATRHGMIGNAVFAPSMRIDDFTLAPAVAPTVGRLKLYADGRIWREACDDDPITWLYETLAAGTRSIVDIYYDSGGDIWYVDWTRGAYDGAATSLDWVYGGVTSGTARHQDTTGDAQPLIGTSAADPPSEVIIGRYDGPGASGGITNEQRAYQGRHPLKVWDGTTIQTVCMAPA